MGTFRVAGSAEVSVHLEIRAEKCTGCRVCENFCSFYHEGTIWPARSRITIVAQSDDGPFTPTVCRQCEDATCAASCPVEAITRDERTGAWLVDVEECIGCGDCVEACPFKGVAFDDERGIPLKCDLCGGEPECAAMCPSGAITLERET
jgi:carbon-monoxide dehydrogenase iron sulfur subunit